MTEQDRAAFDKLMRNAEIPGWREASFETVWRAALDHARRTQSEQVRELVDLLERIKDRWLPVQTDDLARMDCNDVDDAIATLAAQLKEQPNEA